MKQRVVTACVLLVLLSTMLFLAPPIVWSVFVLFVVGVAAYEWAGCLKLKGVNSFMLAGASSLCVGVLCFLAGADLITWRASWAISIVFWSLVAPVKFTLWARGAREFPNSRLVEILFCLAVLAAAGTSLIYLHSVDKALLVLLLAIAWVADSFAYFGGRAFGRHKLAPSISPGKTWEGFFTGLLGCGLYAFFVFSPYVEKIHIEVSMLTVVVGVLFFGIVTVVGDLFESLIKRRAGIKDSGKILPGHGGVLDRVDSLLALLPFAASAVFYIS